MLEDNNIELPLKWKILSFFIGFALGLIIMLNF